MTYDLCDGVAAAVDRREQRVGSFLSELALYFTGRHAISIYYDKHTVKTSEEIHFGLE